MMTKRLVGIILLVGITLSIRGVDKLVLKYRETTRKKIQLHTYTVTPLENGYSIQLMREGGQINSREDIETDNHYSCLNWRYSEGKGSEVEARREGNVIHIQGQFRGQPISKSLSIDSSPWKQLFSIDFEPFARFEGPPQTFWSVGTSGPGEMKAAKFTVRHMGKTYIRFQEKTVHCIQLRISLSGARSVLWKGNYWFRSEDGRYLRYRGNSGPFTAITVKELVTEEGTG